MSMLLWYAKLCVSARVGSQVSMCMLLAWLLHRLSMGREPNSIKQSNEYKEMVNSNSNS